MEMKAFAVFATVNDKRYFTKVFAKSALGAEHKILDMGICGRHEYGVQSCIAFDESGMKTDTAVAMLFNSELININELAQIIEARNKAIKASDEAEDRVDEIKKELKRLQAELKEAEGRIRR